MRECEQELVANQIKQEGLLKYVFKVLAATSLACAAFVLGSEIASGQFTTAENITVGVSTVLGIIAVAEARDSSREIRYLSGQRDN